MTRRPISGRVSETHPVLPPLQASLVHTTETTRLRYFMDLLMGKSWPVMLVGNAGSGKSVLMGDKLESLGTDDYLVQAVPFNFYTTSAMLQGEAGSALHPSRGGGPPSAQLHPRSIPQLEEWNNPKLPAAVASDHLCIPEQGGPLPAPPPHSCISQRPPPGKAFSAPETTPNLLSWRVEGGQLLEPTATQQVPPTGL